jgi:hypothetical protein
MEKEEEEEEEEEEDNGISSSRQEVNAIEPRHLSGPEGCNRAVRVSKFSFKEEEREGGIPSVSFHTKERARLISFP